MSIDALSPTMINRESTALRADRAERVDRAESRDVEPRARGRETGASRETTSAEPTPRGQAHGVTRKLGTGHFNSVAEARLTSHFGNQVTASQSDGQSDQADETAKSDDVSLSNTDDSHDGTSKNALVDTHDDNVQPDGKGVEAHSGQHIATDQAAEPLHTTLVDANAPQAMTAPRINLLA